MGLRQLQSRLGLLGLLIAIVQLQPAAALGGLWERKMLVAPDVSNCPWGNAGGTQYYCEPAFTVISPSSDKLALGDAVASAVRVFDVAVTGALLATVSLPSKSWGQYNPAVFLPSGGPLVVASDEDFFLVDFSSAPPATWAGTLAFSTGAGEIMSLAASPDGTTLLSGHPSRGKVEAWTITYSPTGTVASFLAQRTFPTVTTTDKFPFMLQWNPQSTGFLTVETASWAGSGTVGSHTVYRNLQGASVEMQTAQPPSCLAGWGVGLVAPRQATFGADGTEIVVLWDDQSSDPGLAGTFGVSRYATATGRALTGGDVCVSDRDYFTTSSRYTIEIQNTLSANGTHVFASFCQAIGVQGLDNCRSAGGTQGVLYYDLQSRSAVQTWALPSTFLVAGAKVAPDGRFAVAGDLSSGGVWRYSLGHQLGTPTPTPTPTPTQTATPLIGISNAIGWLPNSAVVGGPSARRAPPGPATAPAPPSSPSGTSSCSG